MRQPLDLAVAKLNASLLAIEREAEKDLSKELRQVGNEARDVIRGSTADPYLTGETRKSVRTSVRRKWEVSLYSNLPQAPVLEFGGTIKPRGAPISFEPTHFVSGTVLAMADEIDEQLADAFDRSAHRHGFIG